MIDVVWANWNPRAPILGYWDQHPVEELTAGDPFTASYQFAPTSLDDGAVIVMAAGSQQDHADEIVAFVESLRWALVILASDEGAAFPADRLPHDARHEVWGQYHAEAAYDRLLPIGPPHQTNVRPVADPPFPTLFIGQVTHERRRELVDQLRKIDDAVWFATDGFGRGFEREFYLRLLPLARVLPCPSGPVSLDSFRLYEALECRTVPVIENRTPSGVTGGFWHQLFGEDHPIPTLTHWAGLHDFVAEYADLDRWRTKTDELAAWYTHWKSSLRTQLLNTCERLRS